MTILTPPNYADFRRLSFGPMERNLHNLGALTEGGQTIETPTGLWVGSYTLKPFTKNDVTAAQWRAFFVQLGGMAGRFYIGDLHRLAPLGAVGGTPLVNGADQIGNTLAIDGASNNITNWLRRGDYFHFDTPTGLREMKMIVDSDVDTNGSGEATLTFFPPIRESPADNQAIVTTNPTAVMQLVDDKQIQWDEDPAFVSGVGFRAVESVDIT